MIKTLTNNTAKTKPVQLAATIIFILPKIATYIGRVTINGSIRLQIHKVQVS
jgi:hypothetical protein